MIKKSIKISTTSKTYGGGSVLDRLLDLHIMIEKDGFMGVFLRRKTGKKDLLLAEGNTQLTPEELKDFKKSLKNNTLGFRLEDSSVRTLFDVHVVSSEEK